MTRPDLPVMRLALSAVAAIGVLGAPAPGAAQTAPSDKVATAQGLYEAAAALIKAGRQPEACPKLEESQRLDPALSTQFFLADCYEATGRPTSAWTLFLEVATGAKAEGNVQREATARARAAALSSKLPRLAVIVPEDTAKVPGLTVTRDGTPLKAVVWGAGVPVDLGEHLVRATAPGRVPWEAKVTVKEMGERREVQVPPLPDALAPPPTPPEPPATPKTSVTTAPPPVPPAAPASVTTAEKPPVPAPGWPGQRVAAVVTGSVGAAGLIVGGVLGGLALSAWNQATSSCPSQAGCSPDAHDASTRSVMLGNGATVAFAAGGALAATGIILWLTTPSPRAVARVGLMPAAAPGVAGVSMGGAF